MQSIVSYPNRGNYGDSKWRGNCSGKLIKDMLLFLKPKTFADPACGSDTAGDVCRELLSEGTEIEYFGFDLHSGFNLLKDSLSERVGGKPLDFIFFHPPYFNLLLYSNNMWGSEPHPDDLSRCASYEDFLTKTRIALQNIYEAVGAGKNYSVLVGDIRRNREYISLQSDILQIAPGALDGIVIKAQNNCVSSRTKYSNSSSFIKIQHEYLLNFRKELRVFSLLDTALAVSRRLQILSNANWRATVDAALRTLGGRAKLPEIYEVIEKSSPDKISTRPNWQARVRRTLQLFFAPVERGVWALG